jgi:O-antigen/teichoic acid export membrane protein
LTPRDFGIFAIATMVVGVGKSALAMGLGPALVQRFGSIDDHIDVAWTAGFIVSISVAGLLAIAAPLIVNNIFQTPEALWPLWVLLGVMAIGGLSNPAGAILLRNIDMAQWFWMTVPATCSRFLGSIVFALFYPSGWALVFGYALWYLLEVTASYVVIAGRPRFVWDLKKFRELYAFGGWLQLKNILKSLARFLDTAFVGSMLGPHQLGFYDRAMTLARLPSDQVHSVVDLVTFPMFSAIQKREPERIRAAFKHNFNLAALTVFPVIALVLFFGESIVKILLGTKWLPLTGAFQLLVVAVSMQALVQSFFPLLRGLGYPRTEFILHLIKLAVISCLLYPMTLYFGIEGAALAMLCGVLLAFPIILSRVKRIVQIGWQDWLSTMAVCTAGILILWPVVGVWDLYLPTKELYLLPLLAVVGGVYLSTLYLAYQLFHAGPIESVIEAVSRMSLRRRRLCT